MRLAANIQGSIFLLRLVPNRNWNADRATDSEHFGLSKSKTEILQQAGLIQHDRAVADAALLVVQTAFPDYFES